MTYSITAVFPAYNDGHTIAEIIQHAAAELKTITEDFEVVVVNDGSLDHTAQVLDRVAGEIREVRVIHHGYNRGYGAAITTGFRNATKDLIFYTDGDGQYDVREIHNLISALGPEIGLVNGFKTRRSDAWYRTWIGEVYRRSMRLIFDLPIRDVDCDFRLFRRSILDVVTLKSDNGAFCVEMIRKFQLAGVAMAEVPVTHLPRLHGHSQFFSIRHLARVLPGIFTIWCDLVLLARLDSSESTHARTPLQETETATKR